MRILFINQYYYPDISATSQLLTDLAEDLAAKGHSIEVICCNQKYISNDNTTLLRYETINGVKIRRLKSTNFGKRHIWGRLFDYLSFYVSALVAVFFTPKPDLVVTLTTPPMIGLLGVFCKAIYHCEFVYWTMDLYPDVPVALGVMKPNSITYKILSNLANKIYSRANLILTLGPYMKKKIAQKGDNIEKLCVLYNWSDGNCIKKVPDEQNSFLQNNLMQNKFIVMYAGNMGLGYTFDTVLKAARKLQQYKDIQFYFVGGGARQSEIEDFCEKYQIKNITILPYHSPSQMDQIISASDVSLITLRKDMEGLIVPSKLYGIMAGESPIIMIQSGDNEVGDTIRSANCGFVIQDGDVDLFCEKIRWLYDNPNERLILGRNARQYFMEHFNRPLATEKFHQIACSLIKDCV